MFPTSRFTSISLGTALIVSPQAGYVFLHVIMSCAILWTLVTYISILFTRTSLGNSSFCRPSVWGRSSVVGRRLGYGVEGAGFESHNCKKKIPVRAGAFLSSETFRPAVETMQPHIHQSFFGGDKAAGA
jgi:hypothetical protein